MIRKTLVVAALLLTNLSGIAAAADNSEHTSKNAQKLLIILDSLGMNDPDIKDFVNRVDSHIDKGYLNLTEYNAPGGKLKLRYQLDPHISSRQLEFVYTPDDSHIEATARLHSITVNYKLRF